MNKWQFGRRLEFSLTPARSRAVANSASFFRRERGQDRVSFVFTKTIQFSKSFSITLVLVAFCVVGCVKHQTTMAPPPPNPKPKVAVDVGVRVQTLGQLADAYAKVSSQLPGPNPPAHRKLMAEVFARLETILPMLEGPTPSAEFRQQMQMLTDGESELRNGPASISPDPTIDAGLRTLRDVLTAIIHANFYERSDFTPRLDKFSSKVNDLDTARGPTHPGVVAEAVGMSSQIITSMSQVLSQRLHDNKPTTLPASRPARPATTTTALAPVAGQITIR
jgi:hypothetical protein